MNNYIDNNPWAGLSSYEDPEKAKREGRKPKLFCGREEESHNVAQLIASNILVTLYGKSGTGKTSLLNAGVFPRLRQRRYLPVSIRLSMDALDITFQQAVLRRLTQTINERNGQQQIIEVVPLPADERQPNYLWSYFARTRFLDNEGRTLFPVIVLDQFEEVFRNRRDESEVLLRQIAYLMDESHALPPRNINGNPYKYDFNFRFVASIREDDLYRLEDSIDNNYLPELKRCRYRLHSLNEQGARDAILFPGEGLFPAEEQNDIVAAIIEKSKNEDGSLSTNIISLLCSRIFVDYQKNKTLKITFSLVENFIKDNPFERFYNEATHGFSNKEKSYIEEHFVDSTGRRNSIPESDFLLHVPKGQKLLEGDTHILQRASTSSDGRNIRIELIHDSFCKPLANQKEKREKTRRAKLMISLISGFLIFVVVSSCIIFSFNERQNKLLLNQSLFISEKANNLVDEGDSYTACLLALSVLPQNINNPDRPYTIEAEAVLRKASVNNNVFLRGHTSFINSVEFSPDGKHIISSSSDRTIRIWDPQTGMCEKVLSGHTDGVSSAHYSSDGMKIVSSSSDSTIRIWDSKTFKQIKVIKCEASTAVFNQQGNLIASASKYFDSDKTISIWDMKTGMLLRKLKGHTGYINDIKFSPKGNIIISASSDSTIKVWNADKGNLIWTLRGHMGRVDDVAFAPDGNKIVSTSLDGTLRYWDVNLGKETGGLASGDENSPFGVVFNSDGNKLAFGHSGTLYIWDVQNNQKVISKNGDSPFAFSPNGDTFVSLIGYNLSVWSISDEMESNVMMESTPLIKSSLSPDGKKVVSCTEDGFLKLRDVQTGRILWASKGHTESVNSVAFSSNGKKIVSASDDKTIKVWDEKTGNLLLTLAGHNDRVWSAVFSPDEKSIYSSSQDSTIRVWNSASGKLLTKIKRNEFTYISTFSPDCKYILINYSLGANVFIEDIETGDVIQSWELTPPLLAKFSADGKEVLAYGVNGVKIFDVGNGKLICSIGIAENFDYAFDANLSPDKKNVVIVTKNSTQIWDVNFEKLVQKLNLHLGSVSEALFTQDGRKIVTISDTYINNWDFLPLQELIDQTKERFKNRQLTPEERRNYYLE